jgi:diguanylate cyclase (GGDEF)-like protein/PAS domain S-box-containing protein
MSYQKKYLHQISLLAGSVLVFFAVVVGATVFVVMQRHAEALLTKNLQLHLQSRVKLIQNEIKAHFDITMLVATRPALMDEMQRANARADGGTSRLILNKAANNFLSTGMTAFALFGKDGRELLHAGTFTHQPAMTVLLNLPGRVQLIWNERLLLRVELEMNQAGQAVGKIVTERPLSASTEAFNETRLPGLTTEMTLCAPFGVTMQCFPTTFNPKVMTLPQVAAAGDLMPMAHALAGKTGVVITRDDRNQEVEAVYAPVGNLGLGMVLEMDRKELYAPIWLQSRNLFALLLGLLLIVLLSLRWLLTPLVRRLEVSEAQARQLAISLRHSELASRSITEGMAEGVITTTAENIVLEANAAALQFFGYEKGELIGRDVTLLVPERHRRQYRDTIAALVALPESFNIRGREVRSLRKDGSEFSTRRSFSDIQVGGQRLLTSLIVDISERKRIGDALRASELQLRLISENIPYLIAELDSEQRYQFHNKTYEQLLGLSYWQIHGRSAAEVMGHDAHDLVRDKIEVVLRGYPVNFEQEIATQQGSRRLFSMTYLPRYGDDTNLGKTIGFYALGVDITEIKQASDKLTYLANYDSLTGLPNRDLFKKRLEQGIAAAQANDGLLAVVFLDLVRFKNVNDTLGHDIGDQMLKEVATRLLGTVRSTDTVARMSGDEFTVVVTDMDNIGDAVRTAQRIIEAFELPFRIAGRDLVMSASLGIALFPLDTGKASELLSFADLAMYSAKAAGGNHYQFYSPEMTVHTAEALALENEMRLGLERGEFFLNYQPIVDADCNIVGAEALLRWQNGRKGLISPTSFISLAETTGLIVPIGEWVLRQSCLQAKTWRSSDGASLGIAVNISARHFRDSSLAICIQAIVAETEIDPALLNIEITEGVLMQEEQLTQNLFQQLSKLNISFSIDDFGIGYSNFAYLKRFPIKSVKIDQSFVQGITTDPHDAAVVITIIGMAHSLGIKVVAEGVETLGQKQFLLAHGCDFMQGYYFSRPLLPEAFAELLNVGKPLSHKRSGEFQS